MKKVQNILVIAIFCIILLSINTEVRAASLNISASKQKLNIGEKATITVSSDSIGSVSISSNGGTLEGEKTIWVEKNSQSGITITSSKAGKVTVTATPTDGTLSYNYKDEEIKAKSVTVEFIDNTIKEPEKDTDSGKNENSNELSADEKDNQKQEQGKNTNEEAQKNSSDITSTNTQSTPKTEIKEVSFKDTNETMYTLNRVNLRTEYGINGGIYRTLPEGEELVRTGYSKTNVDGYSWSRVRYNGGTYYCITRSLTTTKPESNEQKNENENENANQTKNETPENTTKEEKNTTSETTEQTEKETNQTTAVETINADLKKLEVTGYTITPIFDANVYEYKLTIPADVSNLDVKTEATNTNVKIEVAGNKELKDGENVITIVCYNNETKKTSTYQIIVTKQTADNPHAEAINEALKKRNLIIKVGVAIVIVLIILCIVVFKKGREDYEEEVEDEYEIPRKKESKHLKTEKEEKSNEMFKDISEKRRAGKEIRDDNKIDTKQISRNNTDENEMKNRKPKGYSDEEIAQIRQRRIAERENKARRESQITNNEDLPKSLQKDTSKELSMVNAKKNQKERDDEFDEKLYKIRQEKRKQLKGGKHF